MIITTMVIVSANQIIKIIIFKVQLFKIVVIVMVITVLVKLMAI